VEPGSNPVTSRTRLDDRARDLYLGMQMALSTLRISHDLKPAMTGWQTFVGAGRTGVGSLIAANDQQPRGY
jgi:hypothetical protein